MAGGLEELEQVYMKGVPFLQKPFTATALRHSITALLAQNRLCGYPSSVNVLALRTSHLSFPVSSDHRSRVSGS